MSKYGLFYDENPWGNIKLPCYPEGHRLFLDDSKFWVSMNEKGYICFFVHDKFKGNISLPIKLSGIKFEFFKYTNDGARLVVSLTSNAIDLEEKFALVTKDIVLRSVGLHGEKLFNRVIQLICSWADFLRPQQNGLTQAEYVGLWGELYTMAEFILNYVSPAEGVSFWVGPEGKKQDFTLNNLAIEVKTSFSSEARKLSISSMEQLEKVTDKLFILHIIANPSEGTSGLSLKDLYEKCRKLVNADLASELLFLKKANALYSKATERQLGMKNLMVSNTLFEVSDSFPAIRTSDISKSIVSVKYEIIISAIKKFEYKKSIQELIKYG